MNKITLSFSVEIPTFATTEKDARAESENFLDSIEALLDNLSGEIEGEPDFKFYDE